MCQAFLARQLHVMQHAKQRAIQTSAPTQSAIHAERNCPTTDALMHIHRAEPTWERGQVDTFIRRWGPDGLPVPLPYSLDPTA